MTQQIIAQVNQLSWILYGVIALVALIAFFIVFNFGWTWIRALVSGAPVKFIDLIALRLRGVPIGLVVNERITAVKSGVPVSTDGLSAHHLAGGSVKMVITALASMALALSASLATADNHEAPVAPVGMVYGLDV